MPVEAMRLAERARDASESPIRTMTARCLAVGGINLSQGLCPEPIDPKIIKAVKQSLDGSTNTYTPARGDLGLRQKVAERMAKRGLQYDPESELMVTVGATGAFVAATQALINPGDEVILFEPFYGYHRSALQLAGAVIKTVPLSGSNFAFDDYVLKRSFSRHTRAVVINTPSNPSGKVFSHQEIKLIGELCRQVGAVIITDEIYEDMVYAPAEHVSPATVDDLRDLTITISGMSKSFNMTGWRLGTVAGPAVAMDAIVVMSDSLVICAPSVLQAGLAKVLDLPKKYYDQLLKNYLEKRNILCDALHQADLKPIEPQGSYYVMADASRLCQRGDPAEVVLEECKVAAVPGRAFYLEPTRGEPWLRFCFAADTDTIKEAARRLKNFK